jgi:hypothetical protein
VGAFRAEPAPAPAQRPDRLRQVPCPAHASEAVDETRRAEFFRKRGEARALVRPFGTVEAINGNIRAMLRRGRGYRDHDYLLLKVRRATASRRLQQSA